jgi:hypothetical protein
VVDFHNCSAFVSIRAGARFSLVAARAAPYGYRRKAAAKFQGLRGFLRTERSSKLKAQKKSEDAQVPGWTAAAVGRLRAGGYGLTNISRTARTIATPSEASATVNSFEERLPAQLNPR